MRAPVRFVGAVAALALVMILGLTGAGRVAAGGTSLTITVTLSGNGNGYYNADGGIHCVRSGGITSGTCSHTYDLSAGPLEWGDAYSSELDSCYVQGASCINGGTGGAGYLEPGSADQHVSIEFRLLDPVTVTVKKSGTGSGTVKSTPRGISCGSDCKSDYPKSSSFTLTATPKSGSKFTKWTGGPCDSQDATCTFNVSGGPYTVTAVFTAKLVPTPTPGVTKAPATPEVTAAPEVTDGPTPIAPTPFPSSAAEVTAGPAPTSPPPTTPAADTSDRSTLILVLGSVLVILLAGAGLFAMRSRRASLPPPSPPSPPPAA